MNHKPRTVRVLCRTPTPGKTAKRIDRWKFDLLRTIILRVVPRKEPGVAFRDLTSLVRKNLKAAEQKEIGSINWYTTTVKLEMEVAGELRRVEGEHHQRLVRTKK